MILPLERLRTFFSRWQSPPHFARMIMGVCGSTLSLILFYQCVLRPLEWPPLGMVITYFLDSLHSGDTYRAFLMTGVRASVAMVIGFSLALTLAILTGRTSTGWLLLFFLLLGLQKIPAIALVHVLVSSKIGIGFVLTTTLASAVVMTFTWLVLHHRAKTLDTREVFALRVTGLRGIRLAVSGLIPHLGSAIGAAARLAMSISIVMVILGEWQGVWADGSIWQFGIGVEISRSYDAIDSEARVLSWCLWLGVLGILLDAFVQGLLRSARRVTGVDFRR